MFDDYTSNFQRWTHEDVLAWLCLIGYSRYRDIFEQNGIDGKDLVGISMDDLEEIGIGGVHTRRLFREIARLTFVEFTFVRLGKKRRRRTVQQSISAPTNLNRTCKEVEFVFSEEEEVIKKKSGGGLTSWFYSSSPLFVKRK